MLDLVICSDKTAAKNEEIKTTELRCEVTTEPKKIGDYLSQKVDADRARVTFCTYQSLDKLVESQHKHGAPDFDLAIVDEAHRTTSACIAEDKSLTEKQSLFIHDATQIRAARHLDMTATPRIYRNKKKGLPEIKIVDMSDMEYFGKMFYHLKFKQAIEAGILCHYRLIVLGVDESVIGPNMTDKLISLDLLLDESGKKVKGSRADANSVLALGAIGLAINGYIKGEDRPESIARTIAFASNIRRSKF